MAQQEPICDNGTVDCIDLGGNGGEGNATHPGSGGSGANLRGGSGGDEEITAGYSNDGGSAGGDIVGPDADCPDLDQNTVLDCTETVAENPGFDQDVKGWAPEPDAAIVWDRGDWRASENSGSIRVKNRAKSNSTGAPLATAAKQCVPVKDNRAYDMFVQMYLRGPTQSAYGSLVGRVFSSEDCSGKPVAIESSLVQNTVDRWIVLQATIPATAGVKSLLVELTVSKAPTTTDEVSLLFDNVLVR